MQWLMRSVLALTAIMVVINGGYWEWHGHVLPGALLVVTGIVGLLFAAGVAGVSRDDAEV